MKSSRIKTLADAFGVLGYLSLAIVWLWAAILVIPWLLKQNFVHELTTPPVADDTSAFAITFQTPPQWVIYVVLFVSFLVVLLAVAAIIKAPKNYVQATSRATTTTATRLAAQMTHHTPLPKRRLDLLAEHIVFILKLAMTIVALGIIIVAAWFAPLDLPAGLALLIGGWLGIWPLAWFGSQFLIMKRIRRQNPSLRSL